MVARLKGDLSDEKSTSITYSYDAESAGNITFENLEVSANVWVEVLVYMDGDYLHYTGKSSTITIADGDNPATVSLKAPWNYENKFNANGGTFYSGTENECDEIESNNYLDVSELSFERLGYTFEGWSTSKNGEAEYSANTKEFIVFEDTTFYAVWQPKYNYMVFLDANGGTYLRLHMEEAGLELSADGQQTYTGSDKEPTISDMLGYATLRDEYEGKLLRDGYELKGFALSKDATTVLNAATGLSALATLKKTRKSLSTLFGERTRNKKHTKGEAKTPPLFLQTMPDKTARGC